MTKSELRKYYTYLRSTLSSEQREDMSYQIASKVLSLPIWNYEYYHIFLPIESKCEVDTTMILPILQGKQKKIVLSQTDFKAQKLHHILLTDDTLIKENKWGIPEPVGGCKVLEHQIDVVFIPLLAYDESGHRVGYGKGFYDAFLSKCKPNVLKIGLSFFSPVTKIEQVFDSDVSINQCVTPDKIYSFQ